MIDQIHTCTYYNEESGISFGILTSSHEQYKFVRNVSF